MSPGHADDVRLDARRVSARLGITTRHLDRLAHAGDAPAPHYIGGRKRWWLSEIVAWETAATTNEPPASLRRGAANLRQGART